MEALTNILRTLSLVINPGPARTDIYALPVLHIQFEIVYPPLVMAPRRLRAIKQELPKGIYSNLYAWLPILIAFREIIYYWHSKTQDHCSQQVLTNSSQSSLQCLDWRPPSFYSSLSTTSRILRQFLSRRSQSTGVYSITFESAQDTGRISTIPRAEKEARTGRGGIRQSTTGTFTA